MATTTSGSESVGEVETPLRRVLGPRLLLLFIIGDVLGTGIYALTGQVAGLVGGAVWIAFACAFAVALLTAASYLELVTKYPRAAGAALYCHKAFGIHFLTFLVTFTVMSSGITSASTASRAFGTNALTFFGVDAPGAGVVTTVALVFIAAVALVNLRGVGESVRANTVLTLIELSGLLIVVVLGAWALLGGEGDLGRAASIDLPQGQSALAAITAATALAFFALVGFEDSVNMAEETHEPVRTFPRVMVLALAIAGVIYILVGIVAVALVPADALSQTTTPLLDAVEIAAPGFPIIVFAAISCFAVANSALLNMLMASRLLYGMAREDVVPRWLGPVLPNRRTPWMAVLFTTALSIVLITIVSANAESTAVAALGSTTSFLLLVVFSIVHVAVLVLRRDPVEHEHFRAPTPVPFLGVALCAYLVFFADRDAVVYRIAAAMIGLGVLLWALTWVGNRALRGRRTLVRDPSRLR
ncbi:APC family permease [Quadrisphaera sp. DSM 44207]|uniref:APC family permease n=1 Tax=Quadrisphaera sp. DSM 44207 TaxID=1881057 RepID=UPI000883DE5B|nr:APC family permease [Quadrisphaera sp. DSM 44207]SDQ50566.1 amino acid/polyamine/organocation transporter, APC superfamily [Quadrisphaera sp. DSM 44207]